MELDENDYQEIITDAARKMRRWERGYLPQDINVRHELTWWVMQETEEFLQNRKGIKYTVGDKIGDSDVE